MRRLTIICDDEWADYVESLVGIVEHGEVYAVAANVRICPDCGDEVAPGTLGCDE